MQIQSTGRHMTITDATRTYVEEKIGRVAKIHDADDMQIEVILHVEKNRANKNRFVAEVTAFLKGLVVRAEEAAPDMREAIDLVADKLERQMKKYKARLKDHRAGRTVVKTAPGDIQVPTPEDEPLIVRTKIVEAKPMTEDEAILQMELLGHDFFVFSHGETGEVNVLYRRNNGDYGVIVARSA